MAEVKSIPLPREIGNLIPAEDRGAPSVLPFPERNQDAQDVFADARDLLLPKIRRLSDRLIEHLESIRHSAQHLREDRDFSIRFSRNNRRSRARGNTTIKEDGSVDRGREDGHLEMGINQGWSLQGMKTASSFLYRNFFEQRERLAELVGSGDRPENKTMEPLFTHVLEDMFKAGRFKQKARRLTQQIPRHGTAIMRYELVRKVEFRRRNFDGSFKEVLTGLEPQYTIWPLENVLVTNPDCPDIEDQEGVFLLTPNTSLPLLEQDEAVFDMDEDDGILMQVGGKFRNLETLRQLTHDNMQGISHPYESIGARVGVNLPETNRAVSNFPILTLIEYEGALPMSALVREGALNPDLAELFGIDVGFTPNVDNEADMETWSRMMDKIPVYRISYTIDSTVGGSTNSGRHLLQFEPDRHKRPRKSLYKFVYRSDGDEFSGLSINDLGDRLERAGDMLNNIALYVAWKNSHPSHLIDSTGIKNRDMEQIERLIFEPDKLIKARGIGGKPVQELIQAFLLQVDVPELQALADRYKFEFELTTGVSAIQKGSGGNSRTLGQDQIKEAKSEAELIDMMLGIGIEQERLVRDMIEDSVFHRTIGEFVEYGARVSGIPPSEIIKVLPSIKGAENEFDIQNPVSGGEDRLALATTLMRSFELAGTALFTDPRVSQFFSGIYELSGFYRSRQLGLTPQRSLQPGDEHILMSQGQLTPVNPADDDKAHLARHVTLMRMIESGVNLGFDEQELESLRRSLPIHIEEHVMRLQLEIATAQGGGGGQGLGVDRRGGGQRALETDTVPAGASGLQSAQLEQSQSIPGNNIQASAAPLAV